MRAGAHRNTRPVNDGGNVVRMRALPIELT
jgi:hypothetical protein